MRDNGLSLTGIKAARRCRSVKGQLVTEDKIIFGGGVPK